MQSYLWNNFLEFLGLKLWYFSVGSINSHFESFDALGGEAHERLETEK